MAMWGLDYLGGAKYERVILKEHPRGWAAGFFTNTFGDAVRTIDKLLATGRCPRVRLHLIWKDDHRFTDRDIPTTVKEAKRIKPLIDKYPNVEFRISPWCEHRVSDGLIVKVIGAIDAVIGGRAIYVNTPASEGEIVRKHDIRNEYHGKQNGPRSTDHFDFSFDGYSCVDADIERVKARFSDAETFYFWEPRFNGRWESDDTTPRPQRRGWPDSSLIDSVIALSRPKGSTALPRNWLYKSHSENHGNRDRRSERPVFIVPPKVREIELRARNGQVVGEFKYYGTFTDGRHRYYGNQFGYLIADKAARIQGDRMCEVFINGRKQGVINPGFRDGSFR